MDKKTFLEELRSSLSVLQETELNDIMDEYEQHIDMKVQSGLTEEEAIAEFGNRKELTAEILEAIENISIKVNPASREFILFEE